MCYYGYSHGLPYIVTCSTRIHVHLFLFKLCAQHIALSQITMPRISYKILLVGVGKTCMIRILVEVTPHRAPREYVPPPPRVVVTKYSVRVC